MKRRVNIASLFDGLSKPSAQGYSSNMKLMMIMAAFLIVTIGLILMQPDTASQEVAEIDVQDSFVGASDATGQVPVRQLGGLSTDPSLSRNVTRANTSFLSVGSARHMDVSKRLRHPIRLDGHHHDIREMSQTALRQHGYKAQEGDKLHGMLVQALSEGQSDAYIDALLNASASKGEIEIPSSLRMASGRLDTVALLGSLAALCNHY